MFGGKSKPRHPLSVCADCGASDPSWASVNRGVLICSDCCSVHRSLGRHISHVKCLKHGYWIPEQLTMVQSLYSCGANSIWEYSLLNPNSSKAGKRKPQSGDPIHPVKTDFIRAKHQQLAYVFKPAKDDLLVTESDLSKQLHSSVRTPNLETSLRLLSQGADPNYFHPEKNSTPLSVAARAGQVCQVELLLVYGADPAALDLLGRGAAEYAKAAGYHGLATRINNAQYEMTDRISYFLCGRRPEHTSNRHYLIPETPPTPLVENGKVARRKMTGLSNKVFEELAVDCYDEVDRRETDALWGKVSAVGSSAAAADAAAAAVVPFLPVNPDYSATRNQGRQKLARLAHSEFASLLVDVLKEVKRRQAEIDASRGILPANTNTKYSPSAELNHTLHKLNLARLRGGPNGGGGGGHSDDDEPLYDSVASDDDYYNLDEHKEAVAAAAAAAGGNDGSLTAVGQLPDGGCGPLRHNSVYGGGGGDSGLSLPPLTGSSTTNSSSTTLQRSKSLAAADRDQAASTVEYATLKEQLECSEKKVQALIASNDDMRSELAKLQSTVQKLVHDNKAFQRSSMSPSHHSSSSGGHHDSPQHNNTTTTTTSNNSSSSGQQQHMLLRGEGVPYMDHQHHRTGSPHHLHNSTAPGGQQAATADPQSPGSRAQSMYEYREGGRSVYGGGGGSGPTSLPGPGSNYITGGSGGSPRNLPNSRRDSVEQSYARYPSGGYEGPHSLPYSLHQNYQDGTVYQEVLPSQEEVVRRTEAITRCIQELLISAKDEKFESFIPCSERIVRAVTDMVLLFPEEPGHSSVSASLSALTAAANHFETECRMLIVRSQKETLNQNFVTQQVIQCAFDIAKATKQLVALFQ